MTSRLLGAALVLGLLSAIGPFAIDMYLPALPSIQQGLHADVGTAQMSLMAFFISLGFWQLVYGPVSDMLGRKPPIYFGLCLFALGSVGCALAPDIHSLIVCRFVQGLGGCAGMVMPRAIVRDMYTGHDAVRLMSLLMLVFSVSPVLAPLAGSLVVRLAGWRGIFWVVTGTAVLGLLMAASVLKETRPAAQRVESSLGSALAAYRTLLKDGHFLGLVFIGAFGTSSFFAYLANSSFVLIDHYGLTPTQYSLAFSVNAVAFIGAAQFSGRLGRRYGLKRVVVTAMVGYAVTMVLLLAMVLAGIDRLDAMVVMLFVGYGFMGLVNPTAAVLALEGHGAIAGTASALMGTIRFITGAMVIAVIGVFVDGTELPMVAGIAGCAVMALGLTCFTLRERQPRVEVRATMD